MSQEISIMDRGELYRTFIAQAANELAALPDNTRIMLSGLDFFPLNPHLFEKVRQGQAQFAVPCDQIYDDLLASYFRHREAFDRCPLRRVAKWLQRVFLRIRLVCFYVLFPIHVLLPAAGRKKPASPAQSAARGTAAAGPLTSIVVLSYNRLPYLRKTIAACLETIGDAPYELIAVDNGSKDGSAEFLKDAHEKGLVSKLLLLSENQGISAGYNQGFALADERSQYLMKLDSDIKILTQGWLAQVVDFMAANEQVGFVALNQINDGYLSLLPVLRIGGTEVMDYSEWQLGSAMVISKRLMDEIGCFIEDAEMTFTPDDVDYYVRASRKGYRAFYLRDVRVDHQWVLDLKNYWGYTFGKPREASIRLALRAARDYDRGLRPLELRYGPAEK